MAITPCCGCPTRSARRTSTAGSTIAGCTSSGSGIAATRPLLACADPGDEPQRGGLLVAAHGRGTYVYSGYSFFRQIPAGVPGAIRLFANLLAIPHVHILERRELARRIELLSFLDDEDLYGVARLMSERWLEAGAVLCRRGDRGDELYVILDGEIEVGSEDEGRWRVQTVLAAGEVIGELAVLTAAPRSRSMRARTETRLLSMQAASFRALVAEYPPLAQRLLRVLAERLATEHGLAVGIICHAGFGGSARVALDLAEELALRGHRVHLFARAPPLGAAGFAPGVVFHRIDGSSRALGGTGWIRTGRRPTSTRWRSGSRSSASPRVSTSCTFTMRCPSRRSPRPCATGWAAARPPWSSRCTAPTSASTAPGR